MWLRRLGLIAAMLGGVARVEADGNHNCREEEKDARGDCPATPPPSEKKAPTSGTRPPAIKPAVAKLDIRGSDASVAGAQLSIDDVAAGPAPAVLATTPGRHRIEVKKAGFETFVKWVDVKPGELAPVLVTLKSSAPVVTAAVPGAPGTEKVYFLLSNATYLRYDMKREHVDDGYPLAITDKTWPGLGGYGDRIIAAFRKNETGKLYLFLSDATYFRYDTKTEHADKGYPAPVDDKTWPGLAGYAKQLCGALDWQDGKIQFVLKDGSSVRYDLKADRVDDHQPTPIVGLAPYASHLTSAVVWSNKRAYIFTDDGRYLRYDPATNAIDTGYPQPVDDKNWPGMGTLVRHPP